MQRFAPTSRRAIAISLLIAGFVAYAALVGLPTKRGNVLIWIALAVVALGIDRPLSTLRSFATTWLPLFAALGAYDLLRGASEGSEAAAHTWPQLDLDLWLGGGITPTEHLQAWFWHPDHTRWWDVAAWMTYQSHFLVPLLLAVVLWNFKHEIASRYIVGIALLSWISLATYWLYPAQPPWMVARDGLTGDVTRIVHSMWADIGVERAARVFSTGTGAGSSSKYANTVAALPSMHAAFPMFIAMMLWNTRRWLNVVLACYVCAMGLTLVYSGEHFTFDILLGWCYAVGVASLVKYQKSLTSPIRRPRPESQSSALGRDGIESSAEAIPTSRSRYTDFPQTDVTRS